MKTKLFIAITIIAIIVLAFTACPAEQKSEPEHVHQWGAWQVTTAPTCTTEGVETKTCALDATHKETRPIAIAPDAHQWGAWTQTKAPTIDEEGEETRTCDLDATHKQRRPIANLESAFVTFHANGGTPEPPKQKVEKNKTATEPQGVTKANNTLEGWYKENAFTTKWNFASDTVTTNVDLYAKWNCNCPNGTIHLVGEICCEGDDCHCEKGIIGIKTDAGIPLTDRDNSFGEDLSTYLSRVNSAFEVLASDYVEEFAIIKKYIKEVRINPNEQPEISVLVEDGVAILRRTLTPTGIRNGFLQFVANHPELTVDG